MARSTVLARRTALVFAGALVVVVAAPQRGVGQQDADARVVTTAAGERYRAGALHRLILGRHYRDIWSTPVRVQVLDLETMAGGLTPTGTGGGMQTRSLRFDGADGREYAFRSVDKDPSAVLDTILQETVIDDLVQDGISAAHPYGALVAGPLLDAVGILHVDPQLRIMPDDPALGEYREEFAGMLGLIEERPDENEGQRTSFQGTERVISSERLTERLDNGPNDRVDARAYLKARLTDVFLGDWDRHRGQWRWATYDTDAPRSWVPVPRDRDQAFSKFDGIATRIVSLYMPQFVRFEDDYPSMRRLHWNARAIDRWFLAELDRTDWAEVAAEVERALTDDVIQEAVSQLPAEIYAINGEELASTLRARRTGLRDAWRELYELVSVRVDVRATDEDEVVVIDRSRVGWIDISITAPDDQPGAYFTRRFLPDETGEIRLQLQGGDDQVTVIGDAETRILVRVLGGEDNDRFTVEGRSRGLRLYDHEGTNSVEGGDAPDLDEGVFEAWEWTPEDRNQPLEWGRATYPIFWTSYSSDLGFFVGGGARFENYGFRKLPFASAFDLRFGYAPELGKARGELDARFHEENSIFFWDLNVRASRLDVVHYYGLGNASTSAGVDFHKVDITMASASVGLGVAPSEGLELTGAVTLERASTQENTDRFFATLGNVYGDRGFLSLGLSGELLFDPLAHSETTGNRYRVRVRGQLYPGGFDVDRSFGRFGADGSFLLASSTWPAVSLNVRGRAEQVRGNFPWHKATFMGGTETVRGWDEQRFAGDASLFGSAELRLRLFRPRVIVPVSVGGFGFADAGRVWLDNDSPGGWHTGVGGGVFLQPVRGPYLFRFGAAKSDEATKFFLAIGLPY